MDFLRISMNSLRESICFKSFQNCSDLVRNNTVDASFSGTFNVINSIQSVFILLLNISLFLFILSRSSLRNRIANQFFLHLQLIHMIIGFLRITSSYRISVDVGSNVLLISMFISLLLTSADRLLALKFPLKYKLVTSETVMKILLLSWLPAVCFVLTAYLRGIDSKELKMAHTILVAVATLILTAFNIMILIIAKNHQHFVRRNSHLRFTKQKRGKNTTVRASYVFIAVVMNFIVFWMPHCIHDVIELTGVKGVTSQDSDVLDIAVKQLTLLNSLSDPILFLCLSVSTQKELRSLSKPSTVKRQLTTVLNHH